MVLTIVSVLVPLAERLRLPHTVLLAIAGMSLGFAGTWIAAHGHGLGVLGDAFAGLAEGESLLNDAVAIAAFGFFIDLLLRQADPDIAHAISADIANPVLAFIREFVGGIVFGFAMARGAVTILPRLGPSDAAIASVT